MQSNQQMNYLGEEKIPKLMLKFSIPCILSLLVSALYNIVDQIFIGNSELSALGNAATGVVFPIFIIAQAFAWCFGDGCAAYLSICQGKKDTKNSPVCIGSGITITLLTSIVLLAVFFPFKTQILMLFGASENSIGMAIEYFNIILVFFPIFMLMNMMNAVIRADGSPAGSMASMLTGAIVNIILDPAFIFGLHWGMKGAALATVIGQTVSFVISVRYFFHTKTFRLKWKHFIPKLGVFSTALKLGTSSFITQMTIVVISLVCNMMLAKYGALSHYGTDIPIAVIGIESKVFTVVINIVVGIILGCQPIISYNYGAKHYERVKTTYHYVLTATVVIGLVSTLLFELVPNFIVGMFGKPANFFQAVGKPVHAIVSSVTRDIICFVPLVLILPCFFGVEGVLYAAPIADFLAMTVAVFMTIRFMRSLGKETQMKGLPKALLKESKEGIIITIAREHGSAGKQVGKVVAEKLNIPFYYKEVAALAAEESGLHKEVISDINANSPQLLHELYLSTNVVQQAVIAQEKMINKIAAQGSCVIVGRAADYVLRGYDNVVRIFIYAPEEYRIDRVMEVYGDTKAEAVKNIYRSDKARAAYYHNISNLRWGDVHNYDLLIDSSISVKQCAAAICSFLDCSTTKNLRNTD